MAGASTRYKSRLGKKYSPGHLFSTILATASHSGMYCENVPESIACFNLISLQLSPAKSFLALESSAAAKLPLLAEIQTAPSSSPPFSEEQLPLMGQDVATDGGGGSRGCSSVYPCLFYCFVTSCFSSKVATACQRCGRHSNLGESFAHVSTLPRHWLQQSQPQRPGQLALERATRLYNRSAALVCEVC